MPDKTVEGAVRGGGGWRVSVEFCGAVIVLLGALALLTPLLTPALASVAFAGVLLAAGAVGALALVSARRETFIWRALWIAVASLAGLAVLYHHWTGRLSLPWVVGMGSAALALVILAQLLREARRRMPWGWFAIGAILSLSLGAFLLRAAPHAGVMILGLFIAANLIAFGLYLIVTGLVDRAGARLL